MKKRAISLILALLMVLTLLPTTVWAGGAVKYASFDVSVWEDGVDSMNCNESASGEGWSYDKDSAVLTLDGFHGKFLMIGEAMTVMLKAGSVNDIAYGLYIDSGDKDVTIAGTGKLKVGNSFACFDTKLVISAAVEIEKRELPSFQPRITVIEDYHGVLPTPEVWEMTPDLSDGTAFAGYTGLVVDNSLTVSGGQLTIAGTEYGIKMWAFDEKQHNLTGGYIAIADTTVSAIYITPTNFDWEQLSANPAIVVGGAEPYNQNDPPLTWKAVQGQYGNDDVQLYTLDGEVAKSARFVGRGSNSTSGGEKTVVGFAVLDNQPVVMIEGLDSVLSYDWDSETMQEDKNKPFIWYKIRDLSKVLTIRAVFSDGTVKEGTMDEFEERGEGSWGIYSEGGNLYGDEWEPGHTYTVGISCSNTPGHWSSENGLYTTIKVKVIPQKIGDMDGDGKTTVLEVQAIYEWLTAQNSLTASQQAVLDINGDRSLDVYDLQYCYEMASARS